MEEATAESQKQMVFAAEQKQELELILNNVEEAVVIFQGEELCYCNM